MEIPKLYFIKLGTSEPYGIESNTKVTNRNGGTCGVMAIEDARFWLYDVWYPLMLKSHYFKFSFLNS